MEANEAPEKIYLPFHPDNGNPCYGLTGPKDNYIGSIEYTRTDAFIEKAVSYIQQNWIWNTKIIEDFKNYMKGE